MVRLFAIQAFGQSWFWEWCKKRNGVTIRPYTDVRRDYVTFLKVMFGLWRTMSFKKKT